MPVAPPGSHMADLGELPIHSPARRRTIQPERSAEVLPTFCALFPLLYREPNPDVVMMSPPGRRREDLLPGRH